MLPVTAFHNADNVGYVPSAMAFLAFGD